MLVDGELDDIAASLTGDTDAVGQLEVELLSHGLDVTDDVSRVSLSFQLGGELHVEDDAEGLVLARGQVVGEGSADEDLLGEKLEPVVPGLEDNVRFDKSTLAPSNAALVQRATEICAKHEREVATAKQAREITAIGIAC